MSKIMILANDNNTIYYFRSELLSRLISENHEIVISVPKHERNSEFEKMGCKIDEINLSKWGTNPLKELALLNSYKNQIKRLKPDLVLTYTAKPNIYGSIACQMLNIPYINNITGLGSAFWTKRFVKKIMLFLQKLAYKKSNCIFFQNSANKKYFEDMKIVGKNATLLPGSGVNLGIHKFEPYPQDDKIIRFILVSRIRKDKGFDEFFEAVKIVWNKTKNIEFHIVGRYDEESYKNEILEMSSKFPVIYHGCQSQKSVHELISKAHCLIHPSYHEGMANVLLEAAATGRPCIASNIPGCREAINNDETGFVFEVKNADDLAESILKFIELEYEKKVDMGFQGRKKMENEFDRNIVVEAYINEIEKVLPKNKKSNYENFYQRIANKEEKISVVGLGYVGMPIAVAFAKKADVIGFDVNKNKIELYKSGIDVTREVGNETIKKTTVDFTFEEYRLKEAKFHIVAVPTPVNQDHTPDLNAVEEASRILGRNLSQGSVVVYESTVYPGVTEEICVPILEKESGLKCGKDFKVGYSPERINPGDKKHRLESIVKVVSGMDDDTLEIVAKVYELVVRAGVKRAESIRVAEAAKVIENSQRDINIAFMNELSIIFNKMGIDTKAVLESAGTKWNFMKFCPGLVGGHCIGVDPYYLTYKAEQEGYHSQVILSGRRINDGMGKYVAENLIKKLIKADVPVKTAKVAILGFTFKENCPDVRNTKVIDIVNELKEYGIDSVIADPVADAEEAKHAYNIDFDSIKSIKDADAVIIAVAHDEFMKMSRNELEKLYKSVPNSNKVLFDVKGLLERKEYELAGYHYWRL